MEILVGRKIVRWISHGLRCLLQRLGAAPEHRVCSPASRNDSSIKTTETVMFAIGKWELESRGVKLPNGHFAPAASATYRSEPRPDEHRMQWLEPTFATEVEAAEWGMKEIRAWLEARLDSGE
ncbi:hypothetical protein [Variovorax paradoxus]|nr:hypothetical protein [Variovorax paradoxus]